MLELGQETSSRDRKSGYWGRNLARRKTCNAVIQLHDATAPPEMVIGHGHRHAHIVLVTKGAYVTSVTGENKFVATPVAVMNPPGTWHRDHFLGGHGSFMTVDLAFDGLDEGNSWHDQSHAMLSQLVGLASSLPTASQIELEERADEVAGQFGTPEYTGEASPRCVARVWDAIMDCAEPWTLTIEQLARIAGLHPNSLPRAFRAQYGITASALSKLRQVELCANAIAKRESSLADIAAAFGYYDQAHLTNAFKRATSLTPSRYVGFFAER